MTPFDEANDPVGHPSRFDPYIRRWIAGGYTDDEIVDELRVSRGVKMTLAFEKLSHVRTAALRKLAARPQATWRNVEDWTEQDFIDRVTEAKRDGRGGYRSVAKRCEGWSGTALLHRWQKVSGHKPWPSGQNAPLHRG